LQQGVIRTNWNFALNFKDLRKLDLNGSSQLSLEHLCELLPNTPKDVVEQFYVDHGTNSDFYDSYDDLNISDLIWEKKLLPYAAIKNCNLISNPDFENWVSTCCDRTKRVAVIRDWNKIGQYASEVIKHWKSQNTWLRSPLFLKSENRYRLVEGHSRYGCLKGLVESGVLEEKSEHLVWVAWV
jgi:hypothetical protein